jgi:hypothetical protein
MGHIYFNFNRFKNIQKWVLASEFYSKIYYEKFSPTVAVNCQNLADIFNYLLFCSFLPKDIKLWNKIFKRKFYLKTEKVFQINIKNTNKLSRELKVFFYIRIHPKTSKIYATETTTTENSCCTLRANFSGFTTFLLLKTFLHNFHVHIIPNENARGRPKKINNTFQK